MTVRGKVIGGGNRPLICLPLLAGDEAELGLQARELAAMGPDLVEWRVDGFTGVDDHEKSLAALRDLREIIGGMPLIFTCRIDLEGGLRAVSRERRLALILRAMESGLVDLVDIELCNDRDFQNRVIIAARGWGVKIILSYHDFQKTPKEGFLAAKLAEAEQAGGDIAKIAVMPNDWGDVLTLLSVTNRARNGGVQIPIIAISMGEAGKISRLAGGLFGSDITFAAGREVSAPGQTAFGDLKAAMALLYGKD